MFDTGDCLPSKTSAMPSIKMSSIKRCGKWPKPRSWKASLSIKSSSPERREYSEEERTTLLDMPSGGRLYFRRDRGRECNSVSIDVRDDGLFFYFPFPKRGGSASAGDQ